MAWNLLRQLIFLIVLAAIAWPVEAATVGSSPQRPPVYKADNDRLLDGFVAMSPVEAELFADAADGRLDSHSLLAAALVAGGVADRRTIDFYEGQVAEKIARLQRSGKVCGQPRERLKAIFDFMHREFLYAGYRTSATRLSTVFDEGHFNCVSASVLFCCLCGRFGIEAQGLEIPGHAMTRAVLPDESLEIEATCPQWFRLIDDPQRRAELIRKTLGRNVADSDAPREFRRVSGVELVATIYYNRGVDMLGQHRFAEAMEANCKAVRLDRSNRTAWGNLLATLNNWAIDEGNKRRYADAVALLETGLAVEPGFQAFAGNYTHVHHCWVESLCQQGLHEEALRRLERAARRQPQEDWFRQASRDVRRGLHKSEPAVGKQPR